MGHKHHIGDEVVLGDVPRQVIDEVGNPAAHARHPFVKQCQKAYSHGVVGQRVQAEVQRVLFRGEVYYSLYELSRLRGMRWGLFPFYQKYATL